MMDHVLKLQDYLETPLQKWCFAFLVSFIALITPIIPAIACLWFLVFVDTFLGMWRVMKAGGWRAIESGKGWRVASKLFVATVVIFAGFVFEIVSKGLIPVVSAISTAFCIVEMISILENASAIADQPFLKFIIDRIKPKNTTKSKED